jgi:hypothetical protein
VRGRRTGQRHHPGSPVTGPDEPGSATRPHPVENMAPPVRAGYPHLRSRRVATVLARSGRSPRLASAKRTTRIATLALSSRTGGAVTVRGAGRVRGVEVIVGAHTGTCPRQRVACAHRRTRAAVAM